MNESLIDQVSDTAFMAAAYRSMETDRPNPMFHDPLAAKLAGEQGRRIIGSLPKQAFIGGWTVVIRGPIPAGSTGGADCVMAQSPSSGDSD